jgi:hypothetical protein
MCWHPNSLKSSLKLVYIVVDAYSVCYVCCMGFLLFVGLIPKWSDDQTVPCFREGRFQRKMQPEVHFATGIKRVRTMRCK